MDTALLILNFALLVATAAATAIAWWRAIAAGRAQEGAEAAQQAALATWSEASAALVRSNQIADITLRGPYAYALLELGTALLAARFSGHSTEAVQQLALDRTRDITEKGFMVGDASTHEITQWVSFYTRFGDIGEGRDLDKYMAANDLVRTRIQLWFRDPQQAIALVTSDPRVEFPS